MAKAKKKATKKPAAKKAATKKPVQKTAKKAIKKTAKKTAAAKKAAPVKAKPALKDLSGFVTPLDDRLLVRLNSMERKTAGGLFIPDTVSDVSGNLEGKVVSVGRGHRDKKGRVRPMDVKLGDRVIFSAYAGSKIRVLNEDLVILREGDVMGVVS